MRLARLLAGLAALAAPACNAVFDIEEAREVSADHDLSDGQEERGRFDLRDVGDAAPAPAERVCATGQKVCFDRCVDIADPRYGCGLDTCVPCTVAHAPRAVCKENVCAILECHEEWADCNGDPVDGCETDLFSSRSCGACGNVCPSEERFCLRGTCSPTSQ